MTIRAKLENKLKAMGMSESQAVEVLDLAIPRIDKITDNYVIDFQDGSDTYPESVYIVIFMSVKQIALEWINENKPLAWYKPMFL